MWYFHYRNIECSICLIAEFRVFCFWQQRPKRKSLLTTMSTSSNKQIHSYIKWTYWVPSDNIKRLIDRGHLIDHITSNSLKKWPIQRLHTDYAANCADDITLMSLNRHRSFLWRPKSLDNAVETIKWMHILFNWWCRLSERCYYRWPPNNE